MREKKILNIPLAAGKSISAIAINISARFRGCRGQSKLARPQDKRGQDKKSKSTQSLVCCHPPLHPRSVASRTISRAMTTSTQMHRYGSFQGSLDLGTLL